MTELAKALCKVATQMQDWLPSVQTKDIRWSGHDGKWLMLFQALEELIHACENQPECTQSVRLRTWQELSDKERREFLDRRYSDAWAEQVYANAIKLAPARQRWRYE